MRVIAGQFRSRVLVAPPGSSTRPTSDRLRETLFNVLGPRLAGSRFADLFAGSGAVGIEALSREAAFCRFVEKAPPAVGAIRRNLASLGLEAKASVEAHPVLPFLADSKRQEQPFDLVFLDPPYESADGYTGTLQSLARQHERWLACDALVVAEHTRRAPLPDRVGVLHRHRLLERGRGPKLLPGRS